MCIYFYYIFYGSLYIILEYYFLVLKYTALNLKPMYKNNLVGCAVKVCALHEGVQRVTNEI